MFASLFRSFRIFDDDGSKSLSKEEFEKGLNDFGVGLSRDQLDELFTTFDKDGTGALSFDEFLTALRVHILFCTIPGFIICGVPSHAFQTSREFL